MTPMYLFNYICFRIHICIDISIEIVYILIEISYLLVY